MKYVTANPPTWNAQSWNYETTNFSCFTFCGFDKTSMSNVYHNKRINRNCNKDYKGQLISIRQCLFLLFIHVIQMNANGNTVYTISVNIIVTTLLAKSKSKLISVNWQASVQLSTDLGCFSSRFTALFSDRSVPRENGVKLRYIPISIWRQCHHQNHEGHWW